MSPLLSTLNSLLDRATASEAAFAAAWQPAPRGVGPASNDGTTARFETRIHRTLKAA